MGRGRAKAKQVKVARQLKYSGGGMDLDQLRAEFGVGADRRDGDDHAAYAELANRYSVDDEDEDQDDLDDYEEEDPDDEDFDDEDALDDEDDLDDEDFDDEDFEDDEDEEDGPAGAARMSRAAGN